jgi:alkylhydroperoxidase family enzyme
MPEGEPGPKRPSERVRAEAEPGPRLPLLSLDEARAAAEAAGVPDYMARLNIFRVLLRHPKLARAVHDLLATLLWDGRLDVRLRELVIMRIGWVTRSEYEWAQHWRVALGLGVSEDDVLAVRDWDQHEGFGPAERAVLGATDEALSTGMVSRETWAACEDALGDDAEVLLELVGAIGTWTLVSGLLRTLEVPLEDDLTSWPPDGRQP